MPSPRPSLAAERTALGRQRSALSLGVVGALLLHSGGILARVAGLLVIGAAVLAYLRRVPPALYAAATLAAALVAAILVASH